MTNGNDVIEWEEKNKEWLEEEFIISNDKAYKSFVNKKFNERDGR